VPLHDLDHQRKVGHRFASGERQARAGPPAGIAETAIEAGAARHGAELREALPAQKPGPDLSHRELAAECCFPLVRQRHTNRGRHPVKRETGRAGEACLRRRERDKVKPLNERPTSSTVSDGVARSERTSVSEQTYQQLRSMILSRELAPGTIITERRLAEAINISRTPLRAAISRLEGEGLIERVASSSVSIRSISIDELLEILVIRKLLESEAAGLAAGRLEPALLDRLRRESEGFVAAAEADFEAYWRHDDALHNAIAEAAGRPLLAAFIRDLRGKGRMSQVLRMPRSFQTQAREHIAVLEALAVGDAARARGAMGEHLDAVRERVLGWLGGS
jgi:DNA-binding GntR family transcriptional regulator